MTSTHSIDQALLFADGGVLGANPSPMGGTWAWCLVEASACVKWASGHILKPGITNNQTEYIAVVKGLEAMPPGWSGVICSDSFVTLCRMFSPSDVDWGAGHFQAKQISLMSVERRRPNRLPKNVYDRWLWAVTRMGKITGRLIKGHPTKQELANGVSKTGLPVSAWNVKCDDLCRQEAREARRALL